MALPLDDTCREFSRLVPPWVGHAGHHFLSFAQQPYHLPLSTIRRTEQFLQSFLLICGKSQVLQG